MLLLQADFRIMTTKVSYQVFGQTWVSETLRKQKKKYPLGTDAFGTEITIVLEDTDENLTFRVKNRALVLKDGLPYIGCNSEPITETSMEFTNPRHPENVLKATHSTPNKERK